MKRDANDTSSNPQTQPDPMAINETNSGQIVNGNFTDTSNGAEIPTVATESAMDAAKHNTRMAVVNSQQTQIPLVWDPKFYHHTRMSLSIRLITKLVLYYLSIVITYRMVDPIIM